MRLQEPRRLSDSSWLLQMRDLAPEEFAYWLIEWGALVLLRRQNSSQLHQTPGR